MLRRRLVVPARRPPWKEACVSATLTPRDWRSWVGKEDRRIAAGRLTNFSPNDR
jgi:hypothetical protein